MVGGKVYLIVLTAGNGENHNVNREKATRPEVFEANTGRGINWAAAALSEFIMQGGDEKESGSS